MKKIQNSFLMSIAKPVTKETKKAPGEDNPELSQLVNEIQDVSKIPDDYEIFWRDIKKEHPEISEQLKPLFKGREKISVKDLREQITTFDTSDEKFWISLDKWQGGQRDLEKDQMVVQLNLDETMLAEIRKNNLALDFFDTFFRLMKKGGHPTHNQTLAWARVYELPDSFVIEEIQSDLFGASPTLRETANSAIDKILEGYTSEERKQLEGFWKKHFIDWDKKLLATIISMARKKGKTHIWIFDEDYKKKYLSSNSKAQRYYKVLPRDLGFKRDTFVMDDKKIPAWSRVVAYFKQDVCARYEVITK